MEDTRKEIRLKYPIIVRGVEASVLKVRRMKVKDIPLLPDSLWKIVGSPKKKMDMTVVKELVPFFSALTDISKEEAGELDISDLMTIAEELEGILGN